MAGRRSDSNRVGGKMRITFRSSGGIAGLVRGCEIDTTRLAVGEGARIEALVAASGLADTLENHSLKARDAMTYELFIEDRESVLLAKFDETRVPTNCGPLLQYLEEHSVPRPVR